MTLHPATSLGEDRATFVRRISRVLGHEGPHSPAERPPAVNDAVVRVVDGSSDLLNTFVRSAAATGMTAHRAALSTAAQKVVEVLSAVGARRIAIATSVPDVAAAVARTSVTVVNHTDGAGFEPLYEVDAGVTDVHTAIAETGSPVCIYGRGQGRGLSLVPPVHIALVRKSDIVPDLIDFWNARDLRHSSGLVLITGPSKTADIEGILITGVHGPREVHIILIEDA